MEFPELDSAELESRVKEKRKSMMEKSIHQSAPSTSESLFLGMSSQHAFCRDSPQPKIDISHLKCAFRDS